MTNVVYLVGSSLYLVGAFIQFIQGRRMKINHRDDASAMRHLANKNSRAAGIQAIGALLFQTSMTGAFIRSLSIAQQEKIVWGILYKTAEMCISLPEVKNRLHACTLVTTFMNA